MQMLLELCEAGSQGREEVMLYVYRERLALNRCFWSFISLTTTEILPPNRQFQTTSKLLVIYFADYHRDTTAQSAIPNEF